MCPRTHVDRKRKRYDNAVDVVVRLHDPTDPSTERTAPSCSAHVQLDDVPRAPIQLSVGDEFRQHDGVVTMMMFYRRRASPKLCDDMTEVEYGGGGHRTRLRNDHEDQLVCLEVPPSSVYKGGSWRGASKGVARPRRRKPTPSRFAPPFPSPRRRGKEGVGEGKGKGGAAPPSLSYSDSRGGGAPLALAGPSLSQLGPNKAH